MPNEDGKPHEEAGQEPVAQEQRATGNKKPDGEIIPAVLTEVLREAGLNPEDPKVRTAIEVSMMAYRGPMPFPPPPLMREWEEVSPGISQKIISWSETQGNHRRSLEVKRTEGDERRKGRAQFIGLTVALAGIAAAIPIAIWGNGWAAAVVAAVGVGGPLAATIFLSRLGINSGKPSGKG